MADILNPTVWSETDASNVSGTHPSWPEGMPGKEVNNAARAQQGALKRFANQINATQTTSGSGSAYTVNYVVAPEFLYPGQRFCVLAHAACAATPTLNINALGAKEIKKITTTGVFALAAGDIAVNFVLDLVFIPALNIFLWLNSPTTITGGGAVPPHTHTITQVDSLQAALDAKSSLTQLNAAIQTEVANALSGNYSLTAADAGKMLTFSAAAVVTINSSVMAANARVDFLQLGAGEVSFTGTATRRASGGKSKLTGQYSGATAWFISASEYALIGDIKV